MASHDAAEPHSRHAFLVVWTWTRRQPQAGRTGVTTGSPNAPEKATNTGRIVWEFAASVLQSIRLRTHSISVRTSSRKKPTCPIS